MRILHDEDGQQQLRPTYVELIGFVAVAAVGYASLLLPRPSDDLVDLVASAGLVTAVATLALISVRRARYSWIDPVGTWLALIAFVPLRDATGGDASPLTALVVLPLLWAALFLRLRDLAVTVGLLAADLLVPLALHGGSASAWRSATLWCCVAAFVAPTVHRVVRRLGHRSAQWQASEARWRAVMDHLPDATVMVLDEDGTIDLVTGRGSMRRGMSAEVGRRLGEVSASNGAELTRMIAAASAGQETSAEMVSTRLAEEHAIIVTPLPRTARTRQVLLLARDVSVVRARQRELTRARDAAEQLFTNSPQPIAVIDATGCLVRVNPAFAALFEIPVEKLVGTTLHQLGDRVDPAVQAYLDDLAAGTDHPSRVIWQVGRGPSTLHLVLSGSLLSAVDDGAEPQILLTLVDVSERHEHEQALAHLADHDPLTGLANRRRFNAQLVHHVELSRRYGARGALLLLDLDHFKEINDTLGHAAGDELITSVAHLLARSVRSSDLVARLGGDEFAILLQETDRAGAERVAGTILERVRDHVSTQGGQHRQVTVSIGVVVLVDPDKDATDLLADADMTMYDAKESGRDTFVVLDYSTEQRPRTAARLAWARRIERALENDTFVLHLQAVQDVRRREVVGAEVLIRLADSEQLVFPQEFLPVAERSDLIVQIDQWVLRHSVALLARIQAVRPDFSLEINLSGRSIGRPDVEQTLRAAVTEHQVDPHGLVFEVTETVAVAQVDQARAFAERLHQLGCTFALDDFGAGFGSFYYLKHLLFDYVKIDGEFIAQVHRNPVDRAIVRSVVGLAHGLGKRVVAEFVSEPAIHDVIVEEGIDLAQGYLIGRPIPAEDFLAELAADSVGLAAR